MSNTDDKTLRDFKIFLRIDDEIADPPTDSVIRDAQQAIAYVLLRIEFNEDFEYELLEYKDDDGEDILRGLLSDFDNGARTLFWVMGVIPSSLHAIYTVQCAIYRLLVEGHIRGEIVQVPKELGYLPEWYDTCKQELGHGMTIDVIPLIRPNPSLKVVLWARDREAGARDHLWLGWRLEEKMTPAAIRDRWNKKTDAERRECAPTCFGKISLNGKDCGRDTVKKALNKAKRERAMAERLFFRQATSGSE
jgi:hypothetical protein